MHRQQVRPPIPPRRAGAAIFAPLFFVLAFITALLPVQSAAAQDAQDPPVAAVGPLEAIAFEDPDLRREIGRWRLGPGQASLHIPHLGNSGQGRLSTLLLGQELAAALFPGSLYSGDDHGCHPDLGSDAFPRLFWRGATAAFLPPPGDFWPPQENAAKPGIGAGPFRADGLTAGSLILFRRSAGPPPGILLLSRLKTLGSDCQQMHHRTYYQRLFVPLDDASAEGGCLELALLDPRPAPMRAERLVFLDPEHLAPELARTRAPYDVALFAEAACQGPPLILSSQSGRADLHLEDFSFRGLAKSLRFLPQSDRRSPQAGPGTVLKGAALASPLPDSGRTTLAGPPSLLETMEWQAIGGFRSDPAIRPLGGAALRPRALVQRFSYPMFGYSRLGFCLADGRTCGREVAEGWCRQAGFGGARSWLEDPGSAADFPTLSLDRKRTCGSEDCSGFREIVCGG